MANKIEKLTASRLRYLATLQHRIKAILELSEETSSRRLKVSERQLELDWTEFNNAVREFDAIALNPDTLNAMTAENLKMQDDYLEAKVWLEELMNENEDNISRVDPNSFSHSSSSGIKLTRLTIKEFSGKYEDWSEFKDIFESCVINNLQMSDIEKLHQLKSPSPNRANQAN